MSNSALVWMTPLDRMVFQNAVKARLTKIKLKEQNFELEYIRKDKYVFFKPIPTVNKSEFVPRGTLKISTVLDSDFLAD